MAKILNINIGGHTFETQPCKLERRKLYGWTELNVITQQGEPCSQASLNNDGVTIIPSGGIKNGILCEDGQWMERSELIAIDGNGQVAQKVPSSFDNGINLADKCSLEDVLNCNITSIYQLTGEQAILLASQISGDIYRCTFNYLSSYNEGLAFVISNGNDVFILCGTPCDFQYVGLEEQGMIDPVEEEQSLEEEELDFFNM